MKTIEQIKEELLKNNKCTNIPMRYKDNIWEWMRVQFKGKSIQIGNMMNSKEFGCCATIGNNGFQVYLTPEDYEIYLSAV